MSRSPLSRYVARSLATLALGVVAACSSPPPPPPTPVPTPAVLIARPHWDQVCREARAVTQPVRVHEIFDTIGLGVAVRGVLDRLSVTAGREATLDFVSHYHANGRLQVAGLWDSTLDSLAAARISDLLHDRVRELGGFLTDASFRSQLHFGPTPRLELGPAIDCIPHITHEDGRPPTGLPGNVKLTAGAARIRLGSDAVSELEISLDARGAVTGVERRAGYERTFREAEEIVRGLGYGPALSNGRPVAGSLIQTVDFVREEPTTERGLDSLFLVQQGFDRRAASFDALLRLGPLAPSDPMPSDGSLVQRLRSLAGVEIRTSATTGLRQVSLPGGPCPAQIVVNGVRSTNGIAAGGVDWLAEGIRTDLTAVEVYPPGQRVVADPADCGVLLIWSRPLSSQVAEPFVGHLEGHVQGSAGPLVRSRILADPGGIRGYGSSAGRFALGRLHPGRYELVVLEEGTVVAQGSVIVTAFTTTEVELRPITGG